MSRITYPAVCDSIVMGTPFTWGSGIYWYIKSDKGDIVCLNNGKLVPNYDEQEALSEPEFRYATSMELK